MLVNISPKEAYEVVKNYHITKGWKPYAIMFLYQAEWESNDGRPVDLIDSLIYWDHYESLDELKEDHPDDWFEKIDEGYSFTNLLRSDDKGYIKEYLIRN